jgi:hypothetical protein
MAGKVTPIRDGLGEPDVDIVALARRLVEMAERGELRGLAVAMQTADGGGAMAVALASGVLPLTLLGAAHKLTTRVEQICETEDA